MKILIIEDHVPTRQLIARSLEELHTVEGVAAVDGLTRARGASTS